MKKIRLIVLVLMVSVTLFNCTTSEDENPVPQVLSLSPASSVAHLPEFTMTVNGQGFVEGSVIIFDGKEKSTTFVSGTQLSCVISPDDTFMEIVNNAVQDNAAVAEKAVSVAVRNPAPGGGTSGNTGFQIRENFEFESPLRLFNSITNGWAGPLLIDSNDNLFMNISEVDVNRYNISFTNHLSASADSGDTWDNPESYLRKTEAYNENLILDDQGNVHFIFHDWRKSQTGIFYMKKSKDTGAWSEPVNIAGNDKSVWSSYFEHKATIQGDKIFVFWTVWTKSYDEFLEYTYSQDNGKTWSAPARLKDLGYVGWIESVIGEDGSLHLIYAKAVRKASWEFYIDVYTARSSDNGHTWSDPVMISNGAGRSYYPQVAYSGSSNNFQIFWIYKKTGLITNSLIENLNNRQRPGFRTMPDEPATGDQSPVPSNDVIPPTYFLNMRSSVDGGSSWSPEHTFLQFGNADDYFFDMHFDINSDAAGNLNLVVNEKGFFYGVSITNNLSVSPVMNAYFTRSIDGGMNWTAPVVLSPDPETIAEYVNSDSSGNIYILLNRFDPSDYFKIEPFISRSIK